MLCQFNYGCYDRKINSSVWRKVNRFESEYAITTRYEITAGTSHKRYITMYIQVIKSEIILIFDFSDYFYNTFSL